VKKMTMLAAVVAVLVGGVTSRAADMPQPTPPAKEHEWLKKFVGEWECDAEMVMEPGKPPVKSTGTETVRDLGGYWIVGENKGECMGMSVTGVMTVGFDAAKKKYVGTWICSMDGFLFQYVGSVDSTGKILTLETEGPNPATGKTAKMKDVVEWKSPDHRVLTSSILGEDGKWVTFVTMNAKRKK
jgi:hypothetical protein